MGLLAAQKGCIFQIGKNELVNKMNKINLFSFNFLKLETVTNKISACIIKIKKFEKIKKGWRK